MCRYVKPVYELTNVSVGMFQSRDVHLLLRRLGQLDLHCCYLKSSCFLNNAFKGGKETKSPAHLQDKPQGNRYDSLLVLQSNMCRLTVGSHKMERKELISFGERVKAIAGIYRYNTMVLGVCGWRDTTGCAAKKTWQHTPERKNSKEFLVTLRSEHWSRLRPHLIHRRGGLTSSCVAEQRGQEDGSNRKKEAEIRWLSDAEMFRGYDSFLAVE